MDEKQRIYYVIDMKSFFASVECAERGLDAMTTKLVVADKERSQTSICLAVSPALKALGVKNRCRLYEIPKNLDYIIAKPRMKKYIDYATKIYEVYLKYISPDDIHVYSIDECFIDATDYIKLYKTTAKDFVLKLISEINNTVHIPASAGIGTNLYLAKIALDITAKHAKDRIGFLDEQKFKKELWHHKPLSDFWQISDGISSRLQKYGISDMEGIAKCDEELLYKEFGVVAEFLIDHSWGKESCTMWDIKHYKGKSKSTSNSQILPCNYSFDEAKIVLKEMVLEGCYRLVKYGQKTSTVSVAVGYGDNRQSSKASKKMRVASNLFSMIFPYIDELYNGIVDRSRPIRKISFDFSNLSSDKFIQNDLFTDYKKLEKEEQVVKAVLNIKEKFGKNSILKGIDLNEKATQKERNNQIGGHNSGENENA